MSRQKMIVLGVVLVAMAIACTANAALTQKASADFDYKYEMDYMPTDVANVDLDSNSQPDFDVVPTEVTATPTWTASGGISTMSSAGNDDNNIFITSNGATNLWPGTTTYAGGYTAEFSAQVVTALGIRGAISFMADTPGSATRSFLNLDDTGTTWDGGALTLLDSNSNTDGYHVFRVVQQPNSETFSVWRDGVLLSDSLAGEAGAGDSFAFGDVGNKWGGDVLVDYLRFTPGAFAPVPEPSSLALLAAGLLGLLAYAWRKRK